MSWITDVRDAAENVGSIATAPFTFGQSQRLVSNSGQDSGLGNLSQHYSDLWRDADIAGLVAGGAYLGAEALAPQVSGAGGTTAGAVTPVAGAEAPASTTATLAQGTLQGGAAAAPVAATPSAALDAGANLDAAGLAASDASGVAATSPAAEAASGGGITGFVKANPVLSIIGANMAGGALSGYANREAQLEAIQKKKEAELELADLPRKTKMTNTSVGGKGVNINMKPGTGVLRRKDGTPVYMPGTGIINSSMNGVRG